MRNEKVKYKKNDIERRKFNVEVYLLAACSL